MDYKIKIWLEGEKEPIELPIAERGTDMLIVSKATHDGKLRMTYSTREVCKEKGAVLTDKEITGKIVKVEISGMAKYKSEKEILNTEKIKETKYYIQEVKDG